MSSTRSAPPFTRHGFRGGAVSALTLVPGVAMYGVAFGIMAAASGFSGPEAILFSGWVYAGGAQMAVLQAWADPVPVIALCLTALAMNVRYLLLGAALRPWLSGLPPHQSYASLLVLGDGNWALGLREYSEGRTDAAFLLSSGLVMWTVWVASTAAGHLFGQVLGHPERFGVDFILPAFFATMAVVFVRRPGDALPLVAGVVAAIVVERMVAGPWYILAGALAGSIVGALRHADPA
jgi:predicted branched-subunit amino acid permease